jgi:hypothetical protein
MANAFPRHSFKFNLQFSPSQIPLKSTRGRAPRAAVQSTRLAAAFGTVVAFPALFVVPASLVGRGLPKTLTSRGCCCSASYDGSRLTDAGRLRPFGIVRFEQAGDPDICCRTAVWSGNRLPSFTSLPLKLYQWCLKRTNPLLIFSISACSFHHFNLKYIVTWLSGACYLLILAQHMRLIEDCVVVRGRYATVETKQSMVKDKIDCANKLA